MADEKEFPNGETPEDEANDQFGTPPAGDEGQEGDLGNLPPLSEFESSEGGDESNLPPLSDFDSGEGVEEQGSMSGLPPISDIPVETPTPTGGNIKPSPFGLDDTPPSDSAFDTPLSEGAFDTPTSDAAGTGFQDLAADSDFTPETPELGPGPDSDMETPMFDSAFGAGDSELASGPYPGAPTQAMETPMFGGGDTPTGAGVGFDDDAFGGQQGGDTFGSAFDGGTPVPDFSPDTAAPVTPATPPPVAGEVEQKPKKVKKGMGVMGVLVSIILMIIGLGIGVILGPKISHDVVSLPMNPWKAEVASQETTISGLNKQVADLTKTVDDLRKLEGTPGGTSVSPEEIQQLANTKRDLTTDIAGLEADMKAKQDEVSAIQREIELKNEDYVQAEEEYEALANQTSIVSARRDGLLAEVDRLQSQVGELEQADQRRMQSKASLEHAIDLLAVQIREGIPLTPEKYSRAARIQAVERLKADAAAANWVDPDLLGRYNELYLTELGISGAREYFFAKVPVTDRFGVSKDVWAECLMNGNWSVYYRTIDGKHVGIYRNTGDAETPRYDFVEGLPGAVNTEVEESIFMNRPEGFEQQLQLLAGKQTLIEGKPLAQRVFDSM